MRTVRLLIAFEGTQYDGWQSQKTGRTLQEVFEKILYRVLAEKINLLSSSRTDSGVHAKGLVASFRTKSALPDEKLKHALNFYLPKDVLVHSAKTADIKFHARYSAKSKVYEYCIWNGLTRPLFEAPFVLWVPPKLDIARMKRAARHLKGRHDFRAFSAVGGSASGGKDSGDEVKDTVRCIKRISVTKEKQLIRMRIEGDGFLTHMVRIIAGTLIDVGRKKISPDSIPAILKSKQRSKAGPTAKAMGLTLIKVKY